MTNARPDIVNEFQPLYAIILKRVALILVRCWIQLQFVSIQAKNWISTINVHESDKYNELVYQKCKRCDLFLDRKLGKVVKTI